MNHVQDDDLDLRNGETRRTPIWPIVVAAAGFVFWCLYFVGHTFNSAAMNALGVTCSWHLAKLSEGMLIYSESNDGRFPPADVWFDRLPATHNDYLQCTWTGGVDGVGYAMSKSLSSAEIKAIRDPAGAAMLFDSVLPGRNAAGDLSSLPDPPRHGTTWPFGGKPPMNNIAYADGHVKGVRNWDKP